MGWSENVNKLLFTSSYHLVILYSLFVSFFFSNQYIQLSQVPILYFYNISTYLSCSCSLLVYVARKVRLVNKKYFASFNDTFFSDSGSFNIYIYIYIYIYPGGKLFRGGLYNQFCSRLSTVIIIKH